MCGIIGALNLGDRKLLHEMCDNLIHRGPDEEGIFDEKNIGLGVRRLSIIDVNGGQQPISNETQDIWTVFNGEIYNYKEIQQELIKKGHKFQTNSDTETIVHAYEEYGLDFNRLIKKLNSNKDEILRLYFDKEYFCYMTGFIAGMPFLGDLNENIRCDRLETPRSVSYTHLTLPTSDLV